MSASSFPFFSAKRSFDMRMHAIRDPGQPALPRYSYPGRYMEKHLFMALLQNLKVRCRKTSLYSNAISKVQPLGFVPTTIQPIFRENPVLRLCLPLALIDDDFFSKGLCKGPVLCFFPHCIGCSAALRDKLDLDFFDKRFVLLYPSFTHKRSTIGVQTSAFDFSGRWLTDFFRQCSEKMLELTEKNNQYEESNPQRRNGRARTLGGTAISSVARPCLHCVTVHCLASSQKSMTSPRKGATSFPSTKRRVPSKARPTMLEFAELYQESNPQRRNGRVKSLGGTGTAISSSLDRALPSLRHRALLGKWPEIDDISSKGHDFVSIDEKRSVPSKARPTMLAFPSVTKGGGKVRFTSREE